VTPPAVRLLTRTLARGRTIRIEIKDAGAGVDPESLVVTIDGALRRVALRGNSATLSSAGLGRGTHRLLAQVSDYQETRNNENVPRILPNTRVFRATLRIR
jgi:hypothetical protein